MAIPGGGYCAEGTAGVHDAFPGFVAHQRTRSSKAGVWRKAAALTASSVLVLAVVMVFNDSGESSGRSLAENGQEASSALGLTELQVKETRDKLKSLHKEIAENQDTASKLDAKVAKEEAAFKGKLLKAKSLEKKGKLETSKEKEEESKEKSLEKRSAEAEKESIEAKKKFVANEQPMEKATKLASHDKRAYRKAELEVADQVAKLSSDPTNAKLRSEVGKLVKAAKTAKHQMESDGTLLTSIEKKVAGVQVGGKGSYDALQEHSLALKKEAQQLGADSKMLETDAAKRQKEADGILARVEAEMKGPEELHARAIAARQQYKKQTALAAKLAKELDAAEPKETQAAGSSAAASGGAASDASSQLSSGGGGASRSSGSDSESDGDKPPKILSQSQSTFLSGLFSNTAPWDKGFHK